ncbi:transcription elongation factor GreA [Actinomyces minihominis]|uniref:transcription elongation factor GreA n=1 Tax=Actinomyces minihominis TaxID=2002838 RepID=UPI000C076890|nr:transcription elongation factor GreA [Actinomyces minihominis]
MADKTWLTQGQYDKLKGELDQRRDVRRPEIAQLIEAARREGDLSENGGYQAAREEQSMNETRILQLEELLRNAEVGAIPEDNGVVEPGMVVVAKIGGVEETFLLGARDAGEGLNMSVYSPTAPIGKALIGVAAGQTTSYDTPAGKSIKVEVISATPYKG